jgi:signal transduction histidine kinase/FixJ family two-component response regulator
MSGAHWPAQGAERAAPLDRRAARLTRLYILALSAVAILSLTGQWLVQQALHRQLRDSTVVNIAGRQRMLSQKLTKSALVWRSASDSTERAGRAAEIATTLALWKQSHLGLQRGDADLHLPGGLSPAVTQRFADLQPTFAGMVAAAEQLTGSADSGDQTQFLKQLLELEPRFLAAMDAVVFELDAEAQARVARLRRIEWVLLTLTLLVLFGEGFLVFKPAVARLREAAHEVVRSREELQLAKEAAESASEQKTRFLATLSHELRNPLHAILGNVELALGANLPAAQEAQLATVNDAARSLLALVNDLLDLACLQAGRLRMQPAVANLREIISRARLMVQPQADHKGLSVRAEFPAGAALVTADPLRLQQVLLNLLGNAVKFTELGEIIVRVTRAEQGDAWRIEVQDTGPGIPLALQPEIFAAFMQADASSKREQAGVGLGLAISAGLVGLMQGRIGVDSAPGAGSCFWFELPEATSLGQPDPGGSTAVEQPKSPIASLRVLVADDDEVNRRLLGDFLQLLGHQALLADDGKQALAQFQSGSFDAVLLDWHMPELDGWELAREIRDWEKLEHLKRTPLVAITAAGNISSGQNARETGIDRVLTKPLGLDDLQAALADICETKAGPQKRESTDAPSFDRRWQPALDRLQGNRALFQSVAQIFLEQIPQALQELTALVEQSDFIALVRRAHLLQGQAAVFDAAGLSRAASQLEDAAAVQDAGRCGRALSLVTEAAHELQRELEAELASAFPSPETVSDPA